MRLFGLLFPLTVLVPALACSSFGSSDLVPGPPAEADAEADAPPSIPPEDAGAHDGAVADAPSTDSCPARSFCDDFERNELRGEWYYSPGPAAGSSLLEIDATTAASGSRSLFAKTGVGTSLRANELQHKFAAVPVLPFEVTFALKRAAFPKADVRIVVVSFDSGSRVWVTLGEKGLALWMEGIAGGALVSSGGNPAEAGPNGEWSRYRLVLEATRTTLERVNGTSSATIVPYSAVFGHGESVSIGMPQIDPSMTSGSFWLDDVVVPE